jgi:signal peptidase I
MKQKIIGLILLLLVIGGFILFTLASRYSAHEFNGNSMSPTFESGERIVATKLNGEIQRGDIVLFAAPPAAQCPKDAGCDFVKRVIAIPGDKVAIKNNKVFLNGQELAEPYVKAGVETLPGQFMKDEKEITLGENEYFILGDNRPYSSDSRSWGLVDKKYIRSIVQM